MEDGKIKIKVQMDTSQASQGVNKMVSNAEAKIRELDEELKRLYAKQDERASEIASSEEGKSVMQDAAIKPGATKESIDAALDSLIETDKKYQAIGEKIDKIEYKLATMREVVREGLTPTQEEMDGMVQGFNNARTEATGLSKEMSGAGGKGFADGLEKATKKIQKMGMALLGVRGVFAILRKSSSAYLSDNEETSKKLSNVWVALGTYLGPVIEWLVNIIYKGLAYINAFVKALTGVDMIAKRNAKSLHKQASATSALAKAQRQTAGFDEMNKLSDVSGGGSGGSGGAGKVELPKVDGDTLKKIQDFAIAIKKIYNFIKTNWKELLPIIAGFTTVLIALSVAQLAVSLGFTTMAAPILAIGVAIAGVVIIITMLATHWDEVTEGVSKGIQTMKDKFEDIKTKIKGVVDNIKQWWTDTLQKIKDAIGNFVGYVVIAWDQMKDSAKTKMDKIKSVIKEKLNGILSVVESTVNKIIHGMNSMIDKINDKLRFTIPSWVPGIGGNSWSINIKHMSDVSLPRLAQGGITMRPTQAIIGESGREAVLPLENNTEWMDTLAKRIGGDVVVNVSLDGKLIRREIHKANERYAFQTNGR